MEGDYMKKKYIWIILCVVVLLMGTVLIKWNLKIKHLDRIENYLNNDLETLVLCVEEIKSLGSEYGYLELAEDKNGTFVRARKTSSWEHYTDYTSLNNTEEILKYWRIAGIQIEKNIIGFNWNIMLGRSSSCGFYYSLDNQPFNFISYEVDDMKKYNKNSFVWLEEEGDAIFFTKQLRDNWFYYEEHY